MLMIMIIVCIDYNKVDFDDFTLTMILMMMMVILMIIMLIIMIML